MKSGKYVVPEGSAKLMLSRVGGVLIFVGLLDIAYMIYFFSTGGTQYSSSFNILAVIAGVFLRKGNLRAAQFIGFFARFFFLGAVVVIPLLLLIYPPALIETFLRITPLETVLLGAVLVSCAIVLLWWVDRNLQSKEMRVIMHDVGLDEKWPGTLPSLKMFFLFGAVLGIGLLIVFHYMAQSDVAAKARAEAKEELGGSYDYHVSSLSISSKSGSKTVKATVVAYSDTAIETISVDWTE